MTLAINGRFYAAAVTGVQRFAREVAARLLRRGDAVLLLPAGVPVPAAAAGAPIVRGRMAGHAWEQLELPALARGAGCDVVLHLGGTLPLLGSDGVFVVHDVLPLTHPHWFSPRFRAWRTLVLRAGTPRAARVVTVSQWARAEIERVLGLPADRIDVVGQGLEPFDQPASAAAVDEMRRRLGLHEPFLLAIGGGDPRKNVPFLDDVLSRWPTPDPPPLLVVGERARRLFRQVRWRPRTDVRFLGRVDDARLHALYTAAAALCFPSLAEGFGRPPLEALACGTPALVADFGPAHETVEGFAEILPLEPGAWAAAAGRLLREGGEGRAARAEGGRVLAQRYRWDTAAEQVLESCARAERGAGRRAVDPQPQAAGWA